jgi:hypothetical protein
LLGPAVHLLSTFLVNKGYAEVFGQTFEAGVAIWDNTLDSATEENPGQVDNFRFARLLCLGVLAGPSSSEEETHDGEVGGGGRRGVKEGRGRSSRPCCRNQGKLAILIPVCVAVESQEGPNEKFLSPAG